MVVCERCLLIQKEKVFAYLLFGDLIDSFTVVILKLEHRAQMLRWCAANYPAAVHLRAAADNLWVGTLYSPSSFLPILGLKGGSTF